MHNDLAISQLYDMNYPYKDASELEKACYFWFWTSIALQTIIIAAIFAILTKFCLK